MRDPLTCCTAEWLMAAMSNRAAFSYFHLVTLYCFGHLRQSNSVRLLTKGSDCYLGFSTIRSSSDLGRFIEAQDKIPWTQPLTQELCRLPNSNSYRASVGLASVWRLLSDRAWFRSLRTAPDYAAACEALKTLPSNGNFVSKNILEVMLNAVHHSGIPRNRFPDWLCNLLDDFVSDPAAVFGPGPDRLAKMFLGQAGTCKTLSAFGGR